MKECKYYNKHLDTIRAYISCLYGIDACDKCLVRKDGMGGGRIICLDEIPIKVP